ncbi:cytochrome P450 [Delphinella strobiligena]|nr:cytochrome P450 [Delphinella strobiligena]
MSTINPHQPTRNRNINVLFENNTFSSEESAFQGYLTICSISTVRQDPKLSVSFTRPWIRMLAHISLLYALRMQRRTMPLTSSKYHVILAKRRCNSPTWLESLNDDAESDDCGYMHVLKRRWEVEKSINTPAQKLRKISVASGGSPILMDNSGENKAESEVDEEWDDGRDDESGDLCFQEATLTHDKGTSSAFEKSNFYSPSSQQDIPRFPGNNDPSFRKQEMSSKCSDQLGLSDIMGEITFSRSFGFMKRGADDGSLISIEGVLACTAWLGQVPWIYRINEVFRPYIGNNLAVNACNVRKAEGSDRRDILNLLSTKFLKRPASKAKLLKDIDEHYARKGGSKPVTEEEADAMPYLQAVIYEGLRIHPVVGMTLPRVVPASGADISGHFLPRGTVVESSAWVMHRDESVYREDADQFSPGRWLGAKTSDMD